MQTARLILRRPRLADVPALFTFLGDAQAMRFTHVDADLRACRRRIAVHEWQRRRNGFAPWTVIVRETGDVIGWGGLYIDPHDRSWGPELAYFFHPAAWGHGYASELSQASLHVADTIVRLPLVVAFAHPDNNGSQRVLEKAGFQRQRFLPDMQRFLYHRVVR